MHAWWLVLARAGVKRILCHIISEVLNLCMSVFILQLNNTDSGTIITPLPTQGTLTELTSCS